MIKRLREERGGFTLAELLVVVAIVAVLVAIAVPVFSGSLNEANTAVDNANERSVRSEASTLYLTATDDAKYNALPKTFYLTKSGDVFTEASGIPAGTEYTEYKVVYPAKVTDPSVNEQNVQITVEKGETKTTPKPGA